MDRVDPLNWKSLTQDFGGTRAKRLRQFRLWSNASKKQSRQAPLLENGRSFQVRLSGKIVVVVTILAQLLVTLQLRPS